MRISRALAKVIPTFMTICWALSAAEFVYGVEGKKTKLPESLQQYCRTVLAADPRIDGLREVDDYGFIWDNYGTDDEGNPNAEPAVEAARSFLLSALLPLQSSLELKIPTVLQFEMVARPACFPTYCPFGYDFSTQEFWGMVRPGLEKTDLIIFAIEYGKYLFRQNLLRTVPEFQAWESEKIKRLMNKPTLSRLSEQQEIKTQTKTTTKFGFPWDRLLYDYETAFGILFAATAADFHDPATKEFFDHEIYQGLDIQMDGELALLPRRLVYEPQVEQANTRDEEPFLTDLKPSIKWIWINLLNEKSDEKRVKALDRVFAVFRAEIQRRRWSEPNALILDSVMNFEILKALKSQRR